MHNFDMVSTGLGKRVDSANRGHPPHGFAVDLFSQDLDVPPDLRGYLHDKLKAKLAKFGRHVIDVVVRVRDVNGSKGGVDKVCRIEARLAGLAPVNVQEQHEDMRAAIDVALVQLQEAVRRHLDRAHGRQRKRPARLPAQS